MQSKEFPVWVSRLFQNTKKLKNEGTIQPFRRAKSIGWPIIAKHLLRKNRLTHIFEKFVKSVSQQSANLSELKRKRSNMKAFILDRPSYISPLSILTILNSQQHCVDNNAYGAFNLMSINTSCLLYKLMMSFLSSLVARRSL